MESNAADDLQGSSFGDSATELRDFEKDLNHLEIKFSYEKKYRKKF